MTYFYFPIVSTCLHPIHVSCLLAELPLPLHCNLFAYILTYFTLVSEFTLLTFVRTFCVLYDWEFLDKI